jgi:hypothetical protein
VTLDHPIFTRSPAQYPHRLQLFSTPTPNGVKAGIILEETCLTYEPHRIDITADESHDPAFLALNAGKAYEDKRPRDRYTTESARLLGVLYERLAGRLGDVRGLQHRRYFAARLGAQSDRLLRRARDRRLRQLSSCAVVA